MTALDWLLVLVAVIGTVHVSVLKRAYVGHWFWLVSNLGLVLSSGAQGNYPMTALFVVNLVTSIVGLVRWKP